MLSPLVIIVACASLSASSAAAEAANDTAPDDAAVVAALKLDTEYNSAIRPPPDSGAANTLTLYVHLYSIVKVDSTSQEVTLEFVLSKQWTDSRLSWHGKFNSTLDSIDLIYVAPNKVWRPEITVDTVVEIKEVALDNSPISICSKGRNIHNVVLLVTFKCQMEMFLFPFDSQVCGVSVRSQTPRTTTLKMGTITPDNRIEKYFSKSNEFCVQKLFFEKNVVDSTEVAIFVLEFQRRSAFYVTNLLVPSVLLLTISAFAFRMPPDCGERVSFSITIVLSMCVFLQLAGNYTPTQSESVPLITSYFSMAVLVIVLNVLFNIFVIRCHSRQLNSVRVSNRLIRALFLNRLVTGKRALKVTTVDAADQHSGVSGTDSPVGSHGNEWATVVESADKVFFFVYAVLAVLTILFIVVPASIMSRSKCLAGTYSSVTDLVQTSKT